MLGLAKHNNGLHPARDPLLVINPRLVGRQVMPGVRQLVKRFYN
jgi:hypothetical protein